MSQTGQPSYGKTILDEVIMLTLAGVSVFLLVYDTGNGTAHAEIETIQLIDAGIAVAFLGELGLRFYKAESRRNFARGHWWELLCCIPVLALPQAPLLRLLRLVALFRFLRLVIRTREVVEASERLAAQVNIIHLFLAQLSIALAGAVGFHYFEYGSNPNIHNFWDSYWWTIVTITTVGYGDIYPVTTGGRIVAMLLMYVGIGILGAFLGMVGTFVHRSKMSN